MIVFLLILACQFSSYIICYSFLLFKQNCYRGTFGCQFVMEKPHRRVACRLQVGLPAIYR